MIVLTLLATCALAWDCGETPERHPNLTFVPEHRRLEVRGTSYAPIRIETVYQNFDLGDIDRNEYFKDVVMDSVNKLLRSTLLVLPIEGNLILNGVTTCGSEIDVPDAHSTTGIENADMVIYITTTTDSSASWVAYAGACALEGGSRHNVVAGRVVVNTYYFDTFSFSDQMSVLMHEITHILGFSDGLFDYFQKSDSGSVYGENELVEAQIIRGTEKNIFKGPTVVEKAKAHFGCTSLEGVELESQGGSGSAGSHWDMRVAFNDFMIAHVTSNPIYSELTFALLRDSSWYEVDWTYVQEAHFGKDEGCDFHSTECVIGGEAQFDDFCDTEGSRCDLYHIAEGYCYVYTYTSDLPTEYRYFSDPKIGGSDSYIDYCPIISGYSNGDCRDPEKSYGTTEKVFGETAGPNSKCLEGTLIQTGYTYNNGAVHTGCYEVTECQSDHAKLSVGNDNTGYSEVTCSFQGGQVTVNGFNGYLTCPASDVLCGDAPCFNGCYGYGVCVKGKCQCDAGRGGMDCSTICHSSCHTCSGPASTECTSCSGTNIELKADGSCGCIDDYVPSGDGVCVSQCADDCATCSGADSNYCLTCTDSSLVAYNGNCVPCTQVPDCSVCNADGTCNQCDSGHYESAGICHNCETLSGCSADCTNEQYCNDCLENYYNFDGVCLLCSEISHCLGCTVNIGCTSCETGYNPVAGKCQADCGDLCADCNTNTGVCNNCIDHADTVNEVCQCDSGYEGITCTRCPNYFASSDLTAYFSSDYFSIYVDFSEPVLDRSAHCETLVKSESFLKLGTDPVCSWPTTVQLKIVLGAEFTINDEELHLNSLTKEALACGAVYEALVVSVTFQGDPPTPTAHVTGTTPYSLPCSANELILSAASSTGQSQHPLSFEWSVDSTDSDLLAVVQAATTETLTVPDLNLSVGTLTFTVTVTNVFERSDSANFAVTVTDSEQVNVEIEGGTTATISASQSHVVTVVVSSACSSGTASFSWTYEGTLSDPVQIDSGTILGRATHQLLIEPNDLPAGYTYRFKVSVNVDGLIGENEVQLTVVSSTPVAIIARSDGEVSSHVDLVLDGSYSYDPATGNSVGGHMWGCDEAGSVCLDSSNQPLSTASNQPTLTIPSNSLRVGASYTFTLTVTHNGASDTDTVTVDVADVAPTAVTVPVPSFKMSVKTSLTLETSHSASFDDNMSWYQVLGNDLQPDTPPIYSYLQFAANVMGEGQYYAWESKYTLDGVDYDVIHPWYTNLGPECTGGLHIDETILSDNLYYKVYLSGCYDRDNEDLPLKFSYGYMYMGTYYDLTGKTSSSAIYFTLSSGYTYELAEKVYDNLGDEKLYTAYVTAARRLEETEQSAEEAFLEEIQNPDRIPLAIYLYTQGEVSAEFWQLMFDSLHDYLLALLGDDETAISAGIVALTTLMHQEVVDTEKYLDCLELVYTLANDKGAFIAESSINLLLLTLDSTFPEFETEPSIIQRAQEALHSVLRNFMEDVAPHATPVEFSSESVFIWKERTVGEAVPEKTVELRDYTVQMPAVLPLSESDIIDVSVIIILRRTEEAVLDLTLSHSGSVSGIDMELQTEEVLTLTDLTEPIRIEFPVDVEGEFTCVYLHNGEWSMSGCTVETVTSDRCKVAVTHTSTFSLLVEGQATEDECKMNYVPLILTSAMIFILVLATLLGIGRSSRPAFRKVKNPPSISVSGDPSRSDAEMEDITVSPSKGVTIETFAEPFSVRFKRNHIFFQSIPFFEAPFFKTFGIVMDLGFSGIILSTLEENSLDTLTYAVIPVFVGVLAVSLYGIADLLRHYTNRVASMLYVIVLDVFSLGVSAYLALSTCASFGESWIGLFIGSVLIEVLVLHTLYTTVKTALKAH